jgi:hypothetical protein
VKEFIDKTEEAAGTPINRKNLMAIQGFSAKRIKFNEDGTIVETNEDGETLTTVFGSDGSISEIFEGEKKITKTTNFGTNGEIMEVLS